VINATQVVLGDDVTNCLSERYLLSPFQLFVSADRFNSAYFLIRQVARGDRLINF